MSSGSLLVLILVGIMLALISTVLTYRHAKVGPLKAELRALRAQSLVPQCESDNAWIHERSVYLDTLIKERSDGVRTTREIWQSLMHFSGLAALFLLVLFFGGQHPLQGLGACMVMAALWRVVGTDMASMDVLDIDVMAIALLGGWITLSLPQMRWVTPFEAFLSFIVIATLMALMSGYFYLSNRLFHRQANALFGDGDALVLFALCAYFGLDTLLIVFYASVTFIAYILCSRIWASDNLNRPVPFVPAIFAGVACAVILPRPPLAPTLQMLRPFLHP